MDPNGPLDDFQVTSLPPAALSGLGSSAGQVPASLSRTRICQCLGQLRRIRALFREGVEQESPTLSHGVHWSL